MNLAKYSKLIGAVIAAVVGVAIAAGVAPDVAAQWQAAAVAVLMAFGVFIAPANKP